jgi:hypothetical protein
MAREKRASQRRRRSLARVAGCGTFDRDEGMCAP